MKKGLTALFLCAIMTVCCGCTSWEDTGVLDELSQFYRQENEEQEPSPLTAFTLPYVAGETLDPVSTTDSVQQTVGALLYEGLFALNEGFEPEPVLAEGYTYDSERMVYTISLRPDAAFSDGSPVTAQDVADTLRRAMVSQRYGARLSCVSSVGAVNGQVVLYLSRDVATLACRLDIPIVKSGTEGNTAPVGSGPYVFTREENGACLTANSQWWQGKPLPLERIELLHCKDQDSALYAFSSREVQLLSLDLTGTAVTAVSVSGDYTDAPTTVMQFIGINTRREALADTALRQALSSGIDREALVSSCLLGHGQATSLPISPAAGDYDGSLETAYDATGYRSKIQSLLGEDEMLSLTLLVNQENSFKVTAAQEVAFQLSTEQLTVTVEALPWEQFMERLYYGEFDLYYGECRLTADWDVTALAATGGTLNYGGYENEVTDGLLAAALRAGSSRTAALESLHRHLTENVPFLPLCFKSDSVLVTEGVVTGLLPTETDPFRCMWGWTMNLDA